MNPNLKNITSSNIEIILKLVECCCLIECHFQQTIKSLIELVNMVLCSLHVPKVRHSYGSEGNFQN
jgi:hypothetical protein